MTAADQIVTVFCDDIRQETNGKHILIGTYGTDLVPGILPQTIPLALWIRMPFLEAGSHSLKLEVVSDTGTSGINGDFEANNPDVRGAVFAVGPMPVTISKPGTIKAFLQIDGEDRKEVGQLNVLAVGAPRI